jgi:hypothetical protein
MSCVEIMSVNLLWHNFSAYTNGLFFFNFLQDTYSKTVKQFQFCLKLDKNEILYHCDLGHNSLNIYKRGKCFKQRLYRKMKHTFYIQFKLLKILGIPRYLNKRISFASSSTWEPIDFNKMLYWRPLNNV